jgi:hypothetical protein
MQSGSTSTFHRTPGNLITFKPFHHVIRLYTYSASKSAAPQYILTPTYTTVQLLFSSHALLLEGVRTIVIPHGKVYAITTAGLPTSPHVSHADQIAPLGRYGVVLDAGSSVSLHIPKWTVSKVVADQLKGDARPHLSLAEQPQSQGICNRCATTQSARHRNGQEVD